MMDCRGNRRLCPTHRFLERLLDEAVRPNEDLLAHAFVAGRISVVVFGEPGELGKGRADGLGWDGLAAAFVLTEKAVERLRTDADFQGDTVTANWASSRLPGRILVISGDVTLLVNCSERGFSLEPGSTDLSIQA